MVRLEWRIEFATKGSSPSLEAMLCSPAGEGRKRSVPMESLTHCRALARGLMGHAQILLQQKTN